MRGSNLVLVFAPIIILELLRPAFEASTFSNGTKGTIIGIYLSLSAIGLIKTYRAMKS